MEFSKKDYVLSKKIKDDLLNVLEKFNVRYKTSNVKYAIEYLILEIAHLKNRIKELEENKK